MAYPYLADDDTRYLYSLPALPPMPSKTIHKSLIGSLSFGFRENKKGLDSSVFTFRENH